MTTILIRTVAIWLAIATFLPFTPPFQTWSPSRLVCSDITGDSDAHDEGLKTWSALPVIIGAIEPEVTSVRVAVVPTVRIAGHALPLTNLRL